MHWSITQQTATLPIDASRWVFDLAQPQLGLSIHTAPDIAPWRLLQVRPTPPHMCEIEDSFARGSDLMVRYGQGESDRFAFQLDFRSVPNNSLGHFTGGLDVWLSIQTQLLDSHPTLEIHNRSVSGYWTAADHEGRVALLGTLAMLSCQTNSGSVAIFIHPSDQCQAEPIGSADPLASCLRLFGNFMEKGVIRRARLRCLIGPSAVHQSELSAAYAEFASSPLPLTT